MRSGGVKCWGWNREGQLGDGTTIDRSTPVDVVSLRSGVIAIAAGDSHACAVLRSGRAKCWGENTWGELGNGTTVSSLTPVDVSGLSGVAAIAAGSDDTCALTRTGGAMCWGYNGEGELGDGTYTSRLTPVDVLGLTSGVTAIAAGDFHNCALTSVGAAKCWGDNLWGQLGDGTDLNSRPLPVDVSGLSSGVIDISGTEHTCAVTSAGAAKCWGTNHWGELGDGTTNQRLTPVDVLGLSGGAAMITAGLDHTCAVTTTGGATCWGLNDVGELGDGTTTDRLTPVDVVGLGR